MADENQVSEQDVQEARNLGWLPKEEFRGNADNWIDAPQFLERGRTMLPILQKNNERLMGQLRETNAKLSTLETSLSAANAALEVLQESHADDVKEQVEAAKKELREEIARASREGDHEALAAATEKMGELQAANREAGGKDDKKDKKDDNKPVEYHPEVKAWYTENAEFMKSPRKVALANAIAAEMRAAGDTRVGKAFLDSVAEEVDKTLGGTGTSGASRVAGGNGGGGRSNGGSGPAKSYNDLPAEAKAACERMAARLVGPTRAHKDINSWRNAYASTYFKQEQA